MSKDLDMKQTLTDKQENIFKIIIFIVGLAVIVTAICTSLYMYSFNRALWLDEAMLAYSFSQRSLGDLTSSILDYIQSAPVLYLYIVKGITLVFDNSVLTLRIFSFISYLSTIGLCYLIADRLLRIKYPIIPVAFIASLTIMLSYSNEFKPYMTDAMSVLLVILLYYLYCQKNIKHYALIGSFALLIWLSNPVCFFIAAILLYELVEGIRLKRQEQVKFSFVCGIVVFLSFVIYYLYWLRLVVDAGNMQEIWEIKRFPIIPTSVYEVFKVKVIFEQLIEHLGDYRNLIFLICLVGVILNFRILKNRYVSIINLGFLITLIASSFGMFPMHDRMCLFIYPLLVLLFFFYVSQLYSRSLMSHILLLVSSLVILFSARGIEVYSNKDNIYFSEIGWAVDFIEKQIKPDDVLLIQESLWCEYLYYHKYNLNNLQYNVQELESSWIKADRVEQAHEIGNLGKKSNIYYLTGYDEQSFVSKSLLDTLHQYGQLDLAYSAHKGVHTKLIYSYKRFDEERENLSID